jgi:formamidopyrimidine-DNA glycosylase
MPEGPEVRRHAEALNDALRDRPLREVTARTRAAKAWLQEQPNELLNRRVLCVRSHGKNLFGLIEGDYFFYSHLMMWGRWQIVPTAELQPPDRRERARLVNGDFAALLLSAPVFEIGSGDPYSANEYLRSLGPDTLPYPDAGPFDDAEFRRRLCAPENRERAIGVALLDQRISAGIGNYLRAEILFYCRIDPFKTVADLSTDECDCLIATVPEVVAQAYQQNGVTIDEEHRARIRADETLSYPGTNHRQTGGRHAVFRRTNLPCLICGEPVRQLRQITYVAGDDEDGSLTGATEKTRIIYFCPVCQKTSVELKKRKPRAAKAP